MCTMSVLSLVASKCTMSVGSKMVCMDNGLNDIFRRYNCKPGSCLGMGIPNPKHDYFACFHCDTIAVMV